jgi:hypothetical protein
MSVVIDPSTAQVYYDDEDSYGDGGSAGSPNFKWVGMIQECPSLSSYSKMGARGIGSVDLTAIRTGMKKPELNLKWIVQRKRTVATAFNPVTLLAYAHTFPTYGLGFEVLYTYGASPSYVSMWYKGGLLNRLTLDWNVDGWVIANAQVYTQDLVTGTAGVGNSYESSPLDLTNSYALPLTGFDTEVFLDVDGGGDTSTEVKRVHFEIDNKLTRLPVIQASNPEKLKYMARGARTLEGELSIYFANKTAFDYVLSNNSLDIMIDLNKTDNTPRFDFTGCKIDDSLLSTRITEFPCEISLPFKATALSVS